MNEQRAFTRPQSESDQPALYEIRVRGQFGDFNWADWFEDFDIALTANQATVLRGPVADQAALHGLLGVIRNIGAVLIAVLRIEETSSQEMRS